VRRRWLAAILLGALCLTGCQGTYPAGTHSVSHRQFRREYRYARRIFGRGQMGCLVALWDQESGWNSRAVEDTSIDGNPPTYAYGIPQANPSSWGHPFAMGDWRAQVRWGRAYIDRRYGSACGAWAHEQADNWY
jgi:hypothetical protein